MQIISCTKEFHIEEKTAVAIGKFDGIHLGHQKLLSHILDKKDKGLKAAIFTFDPPPSIFFASLNKKEMLSDLELRSEENTQINMRKQLLTIDEKRRKFEKLGVDILVEFPMDMETAHMSPEDFVRKILHEQMNAAYIAAGEDLSYGYKGKGDFDLLNKLAPELGYRTHAIKKLQMYGKDVSSSFVKKEILKGEVERASELLGEKYYIAGTVEHGKQLGRTIGFPTANVLPGDEKCLPPYGVYFSDVRIDGEIFHGMTNIGCRPTVADNDRVSVETYIYDFKKDIYGKHIEIALLTFHRKEQQFSGVNALKEQMNHDFEAGRNYFVNLKNKEQ